jgi:hypothetical protein
LPLRPAPPAAGTLHTRRAANGAVAAVGLALALAAPPSGLAATLEAAVKATYLYKLAPFAAWPTDAFPSPSAPFVICVQGPDPFNHALDQAVAGRKIGGHPIVVSRLSRVGPGSGCQLAYLGGSPAQPRAAALDALRGTHVLTVTDEANGPGPHGMIHFVLRGGRVRFEIDLRQAEAAGVAISSKLLALAVSVVR